MFHNSANYTSLGHNLLNASNCANGQYNWNKDKMKELFTEMGFVDMVNKQIKEHLGKYDH